MSSHLHSLTHKLLSPVEESTAVRAVIVLHVETGRVGLGHEPPLVAEAGEDPLQQPVVVHLLQADDVWAVPDDLVDDPPPPALPVQAGAGGHEVVHGGAEGLGQHVPLHHHHRPLGLVLGISGDTSQNYADYKVSALVDW